MTEHLTGGPSRPILFLSLTQPWATLAAHSLKLVETRSWSTPYRGRLGIHASASFPRWARELCLEEPFRAALLRLRIPYLSDLPLGKLLAVGELASCGRIVGADREHSWIDDGGGRRTLIGEPERSFGDYTPGRSAWIMRDMRPLPAPIDYKGRLGLFQVEPALLNLAAEGAR